MSRMFMCGETVIFTATTAFLLWLDPAVRINNPWMGSFALSMILAPTASAWGGLELACLFGRERAPLLRSRPFLRGLLAGIVALIVGLGFAALDDHMEWRFHDWWPMSISAGVTSLLFNLPYRSTRRDRCASCGYDLRGLASRASIRCPECGTFATASASAAAS